jgi:hypothetical protein
MREGIQTFLREAGEAACYALSIIKIAEEVLGKELPCAESLLRGVEGGFISYNWNDGEDSSNFFVTRPAEFLSALTGKRCAVRVVKDPEEVRNWKAEGNEYTVQCWQREKTGYVVTHFRRPAWDSLTSSVTVREGKLVSLRVFTVYEGEGEHV